MACTPVEIWSDKCGTPVVLPTYLFGNAQFLPADLAISLVLRQPRTLREVRSASQITLSHTWFKITVTAYKEFLSYVLNFGPIFEM